MKRPEFCVVRDEDPCAGCGAGKEGVCESVHGHPEGRPCPAWEIQRFDDLPDMVPNGAPTC